MNSLIEKVVLAGLVLQAPLRYEGEHVPHDKATAVNVHAARRDRGTLLYAIGVAGSKILGMHTDTNADVVQYHKNRLQADGESRIAEAFHRPGHMSVGLRGGPSLFVTHPADLRPPNSHSPILYSRTPVLVPDWVHLEHLQEALSHTSLPGKMIHDAVALVNEVRAHARFMVA